MTAVRQPPEFRTAEDVTRWCHAVVGAALRAEVDLMPTSMRLIAGYHFGWVDERGDPDVGRPGKAVRPSLVVLAAKAVGGSPEAAVPAAVAVELVHNFSLLHDDVMDRDPVRRHRPTAWAVFGEAPAILVGDALLAMAPRALARGTTPNAATASEWLTGAVLDLCEGQHADLAFETRTDVGLDECVRMAEGKTGALLGLSCSLGALVGGATPERAGRLRAFGRHLGLAYQLVDDLLAVWGDPEVTGKPVGADLVSRKKSLLVVAALASDTPAAAELADLYSRDRAPDRDEVPRVTALIERTGAREWARSRAVQEMTEAAGHLEAADCDPATSETLLEVARKIIGRDR
ncbi:family 2 encapsulin nanocompartment cargo protein polyprenyl transferase [Umezawaea endophytica]|uniref:Polyprenyl synthetase family protein n=1 Tax=Umezawaea endophytica TaxID=1654476 RepID=A0A9X2VJG7_9PSEU|nr:family 2 encapsulin nanocompartment cargo protein polyprenyl transferase [Umezawaea endophytica]MCS7477234.1 polyprenyl synthetase family protein [Umezawaea endophytica]